MSAPIRPWEAAQLRNYQYSQNISSNLSPRMFGGARVGPQINQVPPLPPRPNNRLSGAYGYSNYGSSLYGGGYTGGYGYGGYGMPYGVGGFGGLRGDYDSRFLQIAEDATNGTFQSIESFVRAFSSITMMLESTYQALHMSFRSVLSVADNMSKLRSVALNIFSSISILKFIYWLYRKILYMLGLVRSSPSSTENLWKMAESQVLGSTITNPSQTATNVWPSLALFSMMLGAPYLLYRALAPQINANTPEGWDSTTGIQVRATCNFDNPARGELPFKKGDILIVPADFRVHHGWSIAKFGNAVGYIPADRVAFISVVPPEAEKSTNSEETSNGNQ